MISLETDPKITEEMIRSGLSLGTDPNGLALGKEKE
jgi:hypothetical protein